MPIKRVGRSRRVTRRRRNHLNPVKRYISTRRTVKWGKIAKDVQFLKGLVNTEIKYLDQQHNNGSDGYWNILPSATVGVPAPEAGPPTAGYVSIPIDYPQQGDDFNQREGRSLRLRGIQIKGTLKCLSTAQYSGQVRLLLVVDREAGQGTDTDPVPWMYNVDNNGDYTMMSSLNRQQSKRYRIIASKKYTLSTGLSPTLTVNLFKRVRDKILFNGTANSAFMDKMFHIIVLPDANFPVVGSTDITSTIVGQFFSRITYIDN